MRAGIFSAATPAPSTPPAADSGEVLAPASQALYDRGYTLYHQGHFVDAETSFQRFLQGNPDSELADNAQYWLGESYYARRDYQNAMTAFAVAGAVALLAPRLRWPVLGLAAVVLGIRAVTD